LVGFLTGEEVAAVNLAMGRTVFQAPPDAPPDAAAAVAPLPEPIPTLPEAAQAPIPLDTAPGSATPSPGLIPVPPEAAQAPVRNEGAGDVL
jgi:hypothetical protein